MYMDNIKLSVKNEKELKTQYTQSKIHAWITNTW